MKKEENNNIKEEKEKYIYKEIINKWETLYLKKKRKIMADEEGPIAPAPQGGPNPNQNQNQNPQNPPPPLNPFVPNAPQALEVLCVPKLNWSHFKPKYSGKPDEDVETHLLRMNDWMDPHEFLDQVKVQRFCK